MNPSRFGFEAGSFFLSPGRNLRCFGVVAVLAQARLQVSASAVWFGIVDTSLDSAGASRKHNRTPNNDQDINRNWRSRQPELDVTMITSISGIELRDTRGSGELSFASVLRLDLRHPLHPSLLTSLSCFFFLSLSLIGSNRKQNLPYPAMNKFIRGQNSR